MAQQTYTDHNGSCFIWKVSIVSYMWAYNSAALCAPSVSVYTVCGDDSRMKTHLMRANRRIPFEILWMSVNEMATHTRHKYACIEMTGKKPRRIAQFCFFSLAHRWSISKFKCCCIVFSFFSLFCSSQSSVFDVLLLLLLLMLSDVKIA